MSKKRIVVLDPYGTERELPSVPSLEEMRAIVDGGIKHIRVLRIGWPGLTYTSMYVNERGSIDGLRRNSRATDIFLAHIRRRYPHAYYGDAHIAGAAIWFDGWTCKEVQHALREKTYTYSRISGQRGYRR